MATLASNRDVCPPSNGSIAPNRSINPSRTARSGICPDASQREPNPDAVKASCDRLPSDVVHFPNAKLDAGAIGRHDQRLRGESDPGRDDPHGARRE